MIRPYNNFKSFIVENSNGEMTQEEIDTYILLPILYFIMSMISYLLDLLECIIYHIMQFISGLLIHCGSFIKNVSICMHEKFIK